MASAFEAQSADGHLPIILQRFRDQMNIGSSDGGSDGGSNDSGGNDRMGTTAAAMRAMMLALPITTES
jgi:hypothetical protein